jgi:DNA-binding response OmpR family regulator
LDTKTRVAARSGRKLELTAREFDQLIYLAEIAAEQSPERCSRDIWRKTSRNTPIDNAIDVQIARLRRKIDDPFPIKLPQTIRGVGFSLREPQQ